MKKKSSLTAYVSIQETENIFLSDSKNQDYPDDFTLIIQVYLFLLSS
jgi:hypothetical protein